MNRLWGLRTYLAGPMEFDDTLGKEWRDDLTSFCHSLGVWVQDPLKKPFDTGHEDLENREVHRALRETEDWDGYSRLMKKIRAVDLRMVDTSDFIIVHLPPKALTCGTWEELFTGNRSKKPIYVHCPKHAVPGWLYGVLPHSYFFAEWDDLKAELARIDAGGIADQRRWYFADYKLIAPPQLRFVELRQSPGDAPSGP